MHGVTAKIASWTPLIVVRNGAIAWASLAPMPITGNPESVIAATVSARPAAP